MFSIVIQAGGRSTRMGEDKALKSFLGEPLIARVVDRVRATTNDLLVITNTAFALSFLALPLYTDELPGMGPLAGVLTGLRRAGYPVVAMVGCDMPFVSASLLQMAAGILEHEEQDVVIPRTAQGLEPLHAVYRRETCLPAIEQALASGERSLHGWFGDLRVRTLNDMEMKKGDPDGIAFWNINSPEDLDRAERRASG